MSRPSRKSARVSPSGERFQLRRPLLLIVITIAAKKDPGKVTLAWGIVGLLVIVLGLLATQRSYRRTEFIRLIFSLWQDGLP